VKGSQGFEFSVHFNVQQLRETSVTKPMATRELKRDFCSV